MSGLFVIISSPSGGGKDTVIKALLEKIPNSTKLITTTTRAPRIGDQEGVTYYFTDKAEFEKKIENEEMMEYATYANNYYGVTKTELEKKLTNFKVVFSNVDVIGRRNYTEKGIKNLSIFLLPDNLEDLKSRILKRSATTDEDLDLRLKRALEEIQAAKEYDFEVVNKNGYLSETIDNVAKIITLELEKTAK